jgi:hypothetical protein
MGAHPRIDFGKKIRGNGHRHLGLAVLDHHEVDREVPDSAIR